MKRERRIIDVLKLSNIRYRYIIYKEYLHFYYFMHHLTLYNAKTEI